jgi:hypothetical protein
MLLRDKGLEEEDLLPWEGEFICCVCATTAVGERIILLNVLVTTTIATTNKMAVANSLEHNRFTNDSHKNMHLPLYGQSSYPRFIIL